DDALRRVRFVLRAKALGFSLSETQELLGLRVSPGVSCEEVRRAAGAKLSDVERRDDRTSALACRAWGAPTVDTLRRALRG
ncbi:MAG: MerR family DNA-binding protein, partial [Gemmatimonadetes bacterium]|nr:MerR family DNA-binding protein [Gemmatimonadota bacterium]